MAPKLPYGELVAAYVAEHVSGKVWTAKSRQEAEAILNRYGEQCSEKGLDPYSKDGAVAFKAFCVGTLATRTANKHVTRMLALFTWAVDHGHCSINPFTGLKLKKARGSATAKDERDAWTDGDIKILLGALKPADEPRDWLPLLGTYTGARINELCQLYLDDVKKDDDSGMNYLDINKSRPDQKLKNAGSARFVPLHSAVLTAGFMLYVEDLRKAGETRLFPAFKYSRDGYGQEGSRWFGRLRKKLGLAGDFHGLRHTVSTKLREAGVEETTVNELLGHSYGRSMSFSRYAKAQSLPKLSGAIQELKYE